MKLKLILLTGLLASLVANILLFAQGRQYYLDLNQTRCKLASMIVQTKKM